MPEMASRNGASLSCNSRGRDMSARPASPALWTFVCHPPFSREAVAPWLCHFARAQVTGGEMTGRDCPEQRRLAATARHRVGTTGVEVAAHRPIDWTGHVTWQDDALRTRAGLGYRNRGKQGLRIGMLGIGEQSALVGQFDNAAKVHDRDTV